jgi:cysteinyl-tRNA synthetase
VNLKLFDSKTQSLKDFVPLEKGKVGIYLCGPTVQSMPHLGHLRSALVYDQLVRWFQTLGNDVTLIRNVTDIDDKVLDNAKAEDRSWWGLAFECEQAFASAYRKIKLLHLGEPVGDALVSTQPEEERARKVALDIPAALAS